MKRRQEKGFSLLEILVAVGLFAASAIVIMNGVLFSSNLKVRDQNLLRAAFLANNKMVEVESEIYRDIETGLFPDDKSESGVFEGENEAYSWKYEIKSVEIPFKGGEGMDVMTSTVLKLVFEEMSKSVRELSVAVNWVDDDEQEEPEEVRLVTHIVKTK